MELDKPEARRDKGSAAASLVQTHGNVAVPEI